MKAEVNVDRAPTAFHSLDAMCRFIAVPEAFASSALDDDAIEWIDGQMTEILRVLVPVVRDPNLPDWLALCKPAIEGAFEP